MQTERIEELRRENARLRDALEYEMNLTTKEMDEIYGDMMECLIAFNSTPGNQLRAPTPHAARKAQAARKGARL